MFALNKSISKLKSLSKSKSTEKIDESLSDVNKNIKITPKKTKKSAKPVVSWKNLSPNKFELILNNIFQNKNETKVMERGVVMIGNIPHGFYEKEMFGYFSQFGKVLRLRISKNRKVFEIVFNFVIILIDCLILSSVL